MTDLAWRARTLLDLHTAAEILVLANVWDVASARVVAGTPGIRAVATASHSTAAAFGYEDGERIPLDLHLGMVERIAQAVDLPLSMDMEAGYGDAGETARRAIAAGAVGGNLEDAGRPLDEAVAAVEAVLRAGRDAGVDFVLNARTDAMLGLGDGADREAALRDAVARLAELNAAELPELRAECLRAASAALGRITGRVGIEAILDAVFREFCIGK